MYRYIIDIEILKNGNKYQLIDVNGENVAPSYYDNFISRLPFYKKENIKNGFDYLMTIKKQPLETEF